MTRTILTLALICMSAPAFAADKLTEETIKEFYKKSVEVQFEGVEPAIAFFEKHIHKDSQMVMNMITNMKGAPPQKQTIKQNKKTLLKDTRAGYETSKLKTLESSVLSVDIAEDGQSARVKDSTYGVSIINIPTHGGTVAFEAEQSMLCDGEIVIEDGIMQSKDSTCNIEVKMEPVK